MVSHPTVGGWVFESLCLIKEPLGEGDRAFIYTVHESNVSLTWKSSFGREGGYLSRIAYRRSRFQKVIGDLFASAVAFVAPL